MFLGKVAQKWMKDTFDEYDTTTRQFVASPFRARLAPVDRFLEFRDAPTHMRSVLFDPTMVMPASRVVMHLATGSIYLLGAVRQDTRHGTLGGSPYESIAAAREVTPDETGFRGLATVTRFVTEGPANDPGWLVPTVIGYEYMGTEIRTATTPSEMYDFYVGQYYGWVRSAADVVPTDTLSMKGLDYTVQTTYSDMGMLGMRMAQDNSLYVNAEIIVTQRTYDSTEHAYVNVPTTYKVTVEVPSSVKRVEWQNRQSAFEVVIRAANIGFEPKPQNQIELDGITRTVVSVIKSANGDQYKLMCN